MILELKGRIFGENGDITVVCDSLDIVLVRYGEDVEDAFRDAVEHMELVLKAHRFLSHLSDSSLADGSLTVRLTFKSPFMELSKTLAIPPFKEFKQIAVDLAGADCDHVPWIGGLKP